MQVVVHPFDNVKEAQLAYKELHGFRSYKPFVREDMVEDFLYNGMVFHNVHYLGNIGQSVKQSIGQEINWPT